MATLQQFMDAPREFSLIPFWFWNDELTEEEIKRQIDDFEAHGVYGFIPHARIGLPDSIGFASEAWLHFTKVAVDYAAAKGMIVALYDEGMYPSGSCAGKVVAENPRYATRSLERRPKDQPVTGDEELVAASGGVLYVNRRSNGHIRGVHYGEDDGEPGAPPSGDLLNPESTACFFRLALDSHYEALKEHFGKTVKAVFTDEPSVLGRGAIKDVKPWTWGFETFLSTYLGYDFLPHLEALWSDDYPDAGKYRQDFDRAVNARLEQTYYAPYSRWCEAHGVALTGHPAHPGDIGVSKYFQIPGQDIVWRYIEPFQDKSLEGEQSTMAKCSASAQRHYGRTRNANECFGAYGWEFTFEESQWITNWLLVRGVNLLMPHAFYYSVRDKRRDERPPDVGPNNTWWDRYKPYADYCRRMCWLIAQGAQVCDVAILGTATQLPWRAARVLFEHQRDFNYLDCDTLLNACTVDADAVRIRDMAYKALVVDGPGYLSAPVLAKLAPMIESGRVVAYTEPAPGVGVLAPDPGSLVARLSELAAPDVVVDPPQPGLRYHHVRDADADMYLFVNEAPEPVRATVSVRAAGRTREWWNPRTAEVLAGASGNSVEIPPYQGRVLRCS